VQGVGSGAAGRAADLPVLGSLGGTAAGAASQRGLSRERGRAVGARAVRRRGAARPGWVWACTRPPRVLSAPSGRWPGGPPGLSRRDKSTGSPGTRDRSRKEVGEFILEAVEDAGLALRTASRQHPAGRASPAG